MTLFQQLKNALLNVIRLAMFHILKQINIVWNEIIFVDNKALYMYGLRSRV